MTNFPRIKNRTLSLSVLFFLASTLTATHIFPQHSANNTHIIPQNVFLFTTVNYTSSDTTKSRVKDRDGDGIPDSADKCPDEKGVIEYDGCPVPDSDNDGVTDDIDQCPTIAGLVKYKGCPAPDTDGDKINDEDDKCPNTPGVARYDGCPVKDSDNDGVNDDDDKCKDVPGTIQNYGCLEKKPGDKSLIKKVKTNRFKQKRLLNNQL